MSMIRSGIGTDPEVLRHHPLAQRVAGAECRDQFSRPFSSRENYFLLTFTLIEPEGGQKYSGPRTMSNSPPIVNAQFCGTAHTWCSATYSHNFRSRAQVVCNQCPIC